VGNAGLLAALSLTVAAAAGACGGTNETAPLGSASVAPSGAPLELTPPPPGAPVTGLAREGSSIALANDASSVIVADEDASTLRVVTLPLTADATPTNREMPGRPAQVVVMGNTVLVTVRATKDGSGALFIYDTSGSSVRRLRCPRMPGASPRLRMVASPPSPARGRPRSR